MSNLSPLFQPLVKSTQNTSFLCLDNFGEEYLAKSSKKLNLQRYECRLLMSEMEATESLKNALLATQKHQAHQQTQEKPGLFAKYLYGDKGSINYESIELNEALELNQEERPELNTTVVSTKGRRSHLEDAHLATAFDFTVANRTHRAILTAVFDGRDGDECSAYASTKLGPTLKHYLENFNYKELADHGIINALSLSLVYLSQAYNKHQLAREGLSYNDNAGTTANVALQINKELWIANTGDSRAILVDPEGAITQLSHDVGPFEPRYDLRTNEGAGTYLSILRNFRRIPRLAKGGALGQHYANGRISARPAITKFQENQFSKGYLLQMCDGLTDVAATEAIGKRFLHHMNKSQNLSGATSDLVEAAYAAGSDDNISLLLRAL